MKRALIFVIFLLIIIGCEGALTNEEIQARIIEANSNLKSYVMDTKMSMNMKINSSMMNMDMGTELVAHGKVDREDKRLQLVGTATAVMIGMNMNVDTEIYIIDNVMYQKTPMLWTKETMDEDIWRQQDQLESMLFLVDGADIRVVGTERNEKGTYYVIEITPNLQKIGDYMMQQQGDEIKTYDFDYEEIIDKFLIKIWVNKKTYVIEKSNIDMKMVLNNENMDVPEGEGESSISMQLKSEVELSEIGKPQKIELPEEALNSTGLTSVGTNIRKSSMGSITGNVVSDVFG